MKFALTALLGAVFGHQAEMFLQDEVALAAADPVVHTDTIGSASCQAMFGDDIYDLKPLDQEDRDKKHSKAAIQAADGTDNFFVYKLCQHPFKLDAGIDLKNSTTLKEWGGSSSTVIKGCAKEGNAYIVNNDGSNLNCLQSFTNSIMSPREVDHKNGTINRIGWNMVWSSNEVCSTDSS